MPRLSLFWVDVRQGLVEFLAGQSWSMLTPNRNGISPLPATSSTPKSTDVNYVVGLTWTRQPGIGFLYPPPQAVTFGLRWKTPTTISAAPSGGSGNSPAVRAERLGRVPSWTTGLAT